jgi:hypothetical protein
MSDNRKYYYLKLKENYFDDDSIVLLESMQDGVLNFIFEHTLDFIAHGFCAGIAEMDMNLVGCLADFLYHRWRIFRRSGRSSGVCHLHSTGFSVHGAPFSERVCAAR